MSHLYASGIKLSLRFCKFHFMTSSHRSCSMKKVVLKNFAKSIGKHLCQSFFFNKVAAWRLWVATSIFSLVHCHFCLINHPLDAFESFHVSIILHILSLMYFVQAISGIVPTSSCFLGSYENKQESLCHK